MQLRRIPEGTLVRTINAHPNDTYSVDFTPDGALLLTAGADNTVRLWRVADGSLQAVVGSGHLARFSPDGTLLAISTGNHSTEIRRFADGALLFSVNTSGRPVFSPDGRLLTIASNFLWHCSVPARVWRVPEGTLVCELPQLEPRMFAYSPDGTVLAVLEQCDTRLIQPVLSCGTLRMARSSARSHLGTKVGNRKTRHMSNGCSSCQTMT